MTRFLASVLLAILFFLPGPASSSEGGDGIDRAKAALASNPGDAGLRRELGIAYYRAGNDFWAVKVLSGLVEENAADCATRAWLGLALLRRAFPEQALASVDADAARACEGPDLMRVLMVRAMALAALGRDADTDAALRQAASSKAGYDGDVKALPGLKRRLAPDSVPDVAWSVEIGGGYTSNARMGSATDSASEDDGGAPMTSVDARVQIGRASCRERV